MTTIVLPLWGWVLVALAALLLLAHCERDRLREQLRAVGQLRAKRRSRNLKRVTLPDPWSGAIVQPREYFTPHWNNTVGRHYRAWAAQRAQDQAQGAT